MNFRIKTPKGWKRVASGRIQKGDKIAFVGRWVTTTLRAGENVRTFPGFVLRRANKK